MSLPSLSGLRLSPPARKATSASARVVWLPKFKAAKGCDVDQGRVRTYPPSSARGKQDFNPILCINRRNLFLSFDLSPRRGPLATRNSAVCRVMYMDEKLPPGQSAPASGAAQAPVALRPIEFDDARRRFVEFTFSGEKTAYAFYPADGSAPVEKQTNAPATHLVRERLTLLYFPKYRLALRIKFPAGIEGRCVGFVASPVEWKPTLLTFRSVFAYSAGRIVSQVNIDLNVLRGLSAESVAESAGRDGASDRDSLPEASREEEGNTQYSDEPSMRAYFGNQKSFLSLHNTFFSGESTVSRDIINNMLQLIDSGTENVMVELDVARKSTQCRLNHGLSTWDNAEVLNILKKMLQKTNVIVAFDMAARSLAGRNPVCESAWVDRLRDKLGSDSQNTLYIRPKYVTRD